MKMSPLAKAAPVAMFAFLCACAMPIAKAQMEKTLKFIPEKLDFGTIHEEDGKVSRSVKAINISPDTTFIISARTSCGCSAAEYPEQMLAPGDTTDITITYNPLNRPGKFLKTAKIFTGDERIGNSFKLKGTVIPSKKNLDMAYPAKAGCLRLSSPILNAGDLSSQETRPLFIGIYNDSDSLVVISASSDHPAMDAALVPDSIEPFGISTLTVMLKGRKFSERTTDFDINAYIIDAAAGDTIARIPVGGTLKRN